MDLNTPRGTPGRPDVLGMHFTRKKTIEKEPLDSVWTLVGVYLTIKDR